MVGQGMRSLDHFEHLKLNKKKKKRREEGGNGVKLMLRVQLKPSLSQKKRIWHHYLCLLFLGITASVIPCKKSLQPV